MSLSQAQLNALGAAAQLADGGQLPTAVQIGAIMEALGSSGATALVRSADVFKRFTGLGINPEVTIWTPAAGKRFRVMGFLFATTTAWGDINLRDNTAGTVILTVPTSQNVPVVPSPCMGNGVRSAAANNVLTATGPIGAVLGGYVFGTEE